MEEHLRPTSSEARSAALSDLQSPTTVGSIQAKTSGHAKVDGDYHERMELKKRAEAADDAISQFLATVCHEIRTPMKWCYGKAITPRGVSHTYLAVSPPSPRVPYGNTALPRSFGAS